MSQGQRGRGQRRVRSAGAVAAVVAVIALTASACRSAITEPEAAPSTLETPSVTPSSEPSGSASSEPISVREDQVTQLWTALHEELLAQTYGDAPADGVPLDGLATSEAVEVAVSLIETGRSDIDADLVGTELWPAVEIAANGGEARVFDCILVSERPAVDPDAEATVHSQVWRGEAVETQDGWRISELNPGAGDCVPEALNHDLLDAYQQWNRAKDKWWDPPDPDHPLLAETMVQPGLDGMRRLLARHRDMGIVLRDRHDPEATARVVEVGVGRARVTDCYQATAESLAAYDDESGARRVDLSPEPTPGQTDYMIVDLVRTASGEWLVAGHRSGQDSDCVPGETTYVVVP